MRKGKRKRGGQPGNQNNRAKNPRANKVTVRFSDDELAAIRKETDGPVAVYVRKKAVEGCGKVLP